MAGGECTVCGYSRLKKKKKMSFCIKCGNPLVDDICTTCGYVPESKKATWKYCIKCGKPMIEGVCNSCGYTTKKSKHRFCIKCGNLLFNGRCHNCEGGFKAKKPQKVHIEATAEPVERTVDAQTEREVKVVIKKEKCIVCENELSGANYFCPSCGMKYCFRCALVLSKREEPCWACKCELEMPDYGV